MSKNYTQIRTTIPAEIHEVLKERKKSNGISVEWQLNEAVKFYTEIIKLKEDYNSNLEKAMKNYFGKKSVLDSEKNAFENGYLKSKLNLI